MPVELGIWKLGETITPVEFSSIDSEETLEAALESDLSILDPDLMLIGRQITTEFGSRIDLLSIDEEGTLHVIELKRDRTPRDVVAQTLDYASWARNLAFSDIKGIYEENHPGTPFEQAFDERFGTSVPDALNESHELVVVASELDPSTERIIDYLQSEHGVPINAVFFRHFEANGAKFLTRSWLVDPADVEENKARRTRSKREPWNGIDYYVSFGSNSHRQWSDAQRYGFVSGGQGEWYSRTLKSLSEGDRVFVCVPGEGYVGVGMVTSERMPVTEFTVEHNNEMLPILDAPLDASLMDDNAGDVKLQEYLVPVEWIDTRPVSEAVWEKGMFANQNTVCKLRNQFTLDRLTEHFDVGET
jgi:hypothetical protein